MRIALIYADFACLAVCMMVTLSAVVDACVAYDKRDALFTYVTVSKNLINVLVLRHYLSVGTSRRRFKRYMETRCCYVLCGGSMNLAVFLWCGWISLDTCGFQLACMVVSFILTALVGALHAAYMSPPCVMIDDDGVGREIRVSDISCQTRIEIVPI